MEIWIIQFFHITALFRGSFERFDALFQASFGIFVHFLFSGKEKSRRHIPIFRSFHYPFLFFIQIVQTAAAIPPPGIDHVRRCGKFVSAAAAARPHGLDALPAAEPHRADPAQHGKIRPLQSAQVFCSPSRFSRLLSPWHHAGRSTGPASPVVNISSVRPKPWIPLPVSARFPHLAARIPCGRCSKRSHAQPSQSFIPAARASGSVADCSLSST